MNRPFHPILVVGIGNPHRGDDAVGVLVARRLQALQLPDVSVIESNGDASKLMAAWENYPAVILIDAVVSGQKTGTLYKWFVDSEPIPSEIFAASTHSLGIAQAIELARSLDQIPPQMIVYGIEIHSLEPESGLSPKLNSSFEEIVTRIQHDLTNLD